MNFHAISQPHTSIQCDPRVDTAILANPTARTDHCMRSDLRSGADVRILSNDSVRPDADSRRNARKRRDDCRGVNPGSDGWATQH
jgi:hypothetical protein